MKHMAHSEKRQGEVFLTNSWPDHYPHLSDWRTKRRGVRAYDLEGNVQPGYFPVFVQEAEALAQGLDLEAMKKNGNTYSPKEDY